MMLKRVLPFILTLACGLTLGLANRYLFPSASTPGVAPVRYEFRTEESGCRFTRSRKSFSESSHVIVTFKPLARYTDEARRREISGTVRLNVLYGADGTVQDVVPLSKLPYGLTDEAVKAAKQTRFIPAKIYGETYSEWKLEDFAFNLY